MINSKQLCFYYAHLEAIISFQMTENDLLTYIIVLKERPLS